MDVEKDTVSVSVLLASKSISPALARRIRAADVDNNGELSMGEVLEVMKSEERAVSDRRLLQRLLVASLVLLVLFAVATFGTVWAVVVLTRQVATTTDPGAMATPALVMASNGRTTRSGRTLRTTLGGVDITLDVNTAPAAANLYANSTLPAAVGRRLLGNQYLTYYGSISPMELIGACTLYLDHTYSIAVKINVSSNPTVSVTDYVAIDSVTSDICFNATDSLNPGFGNLTGLVAYVHFTDQSGALVNLQITCPTSYNCSAFTLTSNAPAPATGRRLAGASPDSLVMSFGHAGVVSCSGGTCGDRDAVGDDDTGRHLLQSRHLLAMGCVGIYSQYSGSYEYSCNGCFPAAATVQLEGGALRRMADLAVGDRVLSVDASGAATTSPVYVFPHAVAAGLFPYKRVSLTSNRTITASPDHFLYVADVRHRGDWARRVALPAAQVKVGDAMWVLAGTGHAMALAEVVSVEDVMEEGLFAPFTLTGTVVADGVVASVYNTMLGSEKTMHAFCAWGRALWRHIPHFFAFMHARKWASPVAMGIGRGAAAVLHALTA